MLVKIILLAVIIILMTIGFVRAKKEQREDIQKRTMPSGNLVKVDEELLLSQDEEFEALSRQDLAWLINYVGYKMPSSAPKDDPWGNLYVRLSDIRNKKGWWI